LAQFYTNQGLPINVEDIIITTGGSKLLRNGSDGWEMKSSSRTILRKLQWFSTVMHVVLLFD
jgi:hypothetical protein